MTPLTRTRIDQAVENYRYACELMNSDERVDLALGDDIMNKMAAEEIQCAIFETELEEEFSGDFRSWLSEVRKQPRGWNFETIVDLIRIQYPDTHWPILEKLLPFQ